MADTQRPVSDLLTTLFQDGQVARSITPGDVRDLIVSLGQTPYGGMHTLASAETAIGTAGVYVKAAGTTQISSLRNFDMPVGNRLRYVGLIPYHFHLASSISMTAVGNNKLLSFKLYHYDDSASSGAVIDGSRVNRFMATGADEGSTALHWDLVLDTNDYLELWTTNLTDNTNLTVTNLYLFGMGAPV